MKNPEVGKKDQEEAYLHTVRLYLQTVPWVSAVIASFLFCYLVYFFFSLIPYLEMEFHNRKPMVAMNPFHILRAPPLQLPVSKKGWAEAPSLLVTAVPPSIQGESCLTAFCVQESTKKWIQVGSTLSSSLAVIHSLSKSQAELLEPSSQIQYISGEAQWRYYKAQGLADDEVEFLVFSDLLSSKAHVLPRKEPENMVANINFGVFIPAEEDLTLSSSPSFAKATKACQGAAIISEKPLLKTSLIGGKFEAVKEFTELTRRALDRKSESCLWVAINKVGLSTQVYSDRAIMGKDGYFTTETRE